MALTQRTHELVRTHFELNSKVIAVDATCGNGHDTEFLCQLGFNKVYGFDIQTQAINATQERLKRASLDAILIESSHENINTYVNGKIDCVMFNFGYLPSADKSITTKSNTSIKALEAVIETLSDNGLISLMCYPGHPEGATETAAIKEWVETLNSDWLVETHLATSPKPAAPILYIVTRQ